MILLLLASTLSGLSPSEAVLKVYDMACNKGALHLDPSEAKTVAPYKGATPYPFSQWGTPKTLTVVDLTYPNWASIMIATYEPKYPQQMATVCAVATDAITPEDAMRAFVSTTQNVRTNDITRDLNPARANEPFEIDRPKEGYRKRLLLRDDKVVILETDLYKAPR